MSELGCFFSMFLSKQAFTTCARAGLKIQPNILKKRSRRERKHIEENRLFIFEGRIKPLQE